MKNSRIKGFMINESKRNAAKAADKKITKLDGPSLNLQVDNILESVKKRKADEGMLILEGKYPFFKYLNEGEKQAFAKFNDAKKMRVSMLVESKKPNRTGLADIIKEVNEVEGEFEGIISKMPENFKPIWEGLSSKQKENVIALWHTREIKDELEAEAFFESIEFNGAKPINVSESMRSKHNNLLDDDTSILGYNIDDVNL